MRNNATSTGAGQAWQADGPLDPSHWVPVYVLAMHGYGSPGSLRGPNETATDHRLKTLTHQFAERIVTDDCGIPHLPRSLAVLMATERREAEAADAARKAIRDAEINEAAERRRAELAHLVALGIPATEGMSAHESQRAHEEYEGDDEKIAMAFGISTGGTFGPQGRQ